MKSQKLYMLLLGCTPPDRNTEQHDVFFGIAPSLKELIPAINAAWPEANNNIHIDAWREVSSVNGYDVLITEKKEEQTTPLTLFFLNLGGYKKEEFEEFHYKMLAIGPDAAAAIKSAKETAFYKHTGFKGAASHIDDKFAVDVDDMHKVESILAPEFKTKFSIHLLKQSEVKPEDDVHLGYLQLWKIKDE